MRPALAMLIAAIFLAGVAAAFDQNSGDHSQSNSKVVSPPAKWDDRVLGVFFPDARQALVGTRPNYAAAGTAGKSPGADTGAGSTADGSAEASTSGTYAWSKLISADTLEDEIKSLGLLLAADVKTRQGFLGGGLANSAASS